MIDSQVDLLMYTLVYLLLLHCTFSKVKNSFGGVVKITISFILCAFMLKELLISCTTVLPDIYPLFYSVFLFVVTIAYILLFMVFGKNG